MKRLLTLIAALAVLGCAQAIAQEYVPAPVTVSKEKVKLNGKIYLSHVVLEKQTLYGISRAYGVTEDELYEANPSLRETGLQKNAILLIPFKEQAEVNPDGQDVQKDYKEHVVRWYEDIDDISRRYGISVQRIMEYNGLKTRKLSTRQVLKIPLREEDAPAPDENPEEQPGVEEAPADTVATPEPDKFLIPEVIPVVSDSVLLTQRSRNSVDFSLILPLRAGSGTSEMNMDFYSGVLMAMRDLESQGIKAHLHVYDLNAGIPPVEDLLKSDFVLGPVASRDLEAILQRVDGGVPVISPLDQKAAALSVNYKNFIQVPSAADHQYEDLAQWVKEDLNPTDKVILITEKGADNVTAPVAIRSAMAHRELTYEILNYAISEGRSITTTLGEMLAGKDSLNRVIVASESEAFTGDVVRNLGIMQGKGFDLVMYAPSKVRTFETIEGTAYHDADLHITTSYHVDYSDPQVRSFVHAYRALFRTEPSQFAFQGYDTARYFVVRCLRYGDEWTHKLGMERSCGLHTDFLFVPDENGNCHNRAVRRVRFERDYTTTLKR
ncbi:MAG: LysM peptidoglycan-binding domain-containing protein [Bacteroidales bacterium]|nr:LysM peptidoglycan-binding domain-containing protein [Bacteroidales bacterium]